MDYNRKEEYISCNIIEHGFDAQIESINLCCRISKESLGSKVIIFPDYKGEKINWDTFFRITNKLRNIQRQGDTVPQCKGCIYLKKQKWENENYINTININNWIKCNASCIYCDRKESLHKKEYKIYPVIKDLIKNNYLRTPADITIAGGEPTITSDFDKTLKLLIKNNISTVRVLTNAIKYNKYIEKGLKKGLVNILISTDSGSRETYKRIKLTDKHSVVWKNIKKYAKVQKEDSLVKTKYIIIPGINNSKKELSAFIEHNFDAGIKYTCIDLEISFFIRENQNLNVLKQIYDLFLYAKNLGNEKGIITDAFDRIQLIENKLKFSH